MDQESPQKTAMGHYSTFHTIAMSSAMIARVYTTCSATAASMNEMDKPRGAPVIRGEKRCIMHSGRASELGSKGGRRRAHTTRTNSLRYFRRRPWRTFGICSCPAIAPWRSVLCHREVPADSQGSTKRSGRPYGRWRWEVRRRLPFLAPGHKGVRPCIAEQTNGK
jgi:hypothetical protein